LDYFPEVDPKIREDLAKRLEINGIEVLQQQLKELDKETYDAIAVDNPHRLMRALEVCIGSGTPYSTFKNKPKKLRNFKSIKVGLNADREIIYNRINQRVDAMMNIGLLEEVEKLHPYKELNALQTVGYRELFSFLDGIFTKEFAISEIKKNTRRFAKRQLTWFKRDEKTLWFDYLTDKSTIIAEVSKKISELKD
jgi:tRNA dimethylallyltransferase